MGVHESLLHGQHLCLLHLLTMGKGGKMRLACPVLSRPHPTPGYVPLELGQGLPQKGSGRQGGVTHIHVVLQDLWSRLSQVSKAQLELEELGEGVHVWDLTAHLIQNPPHGGELGQGYPASGGQTPTY